MREREIERQLAVAVKKMGGMAVKFVSPRLGWGAGQDRPAAGEKDCFCGVEGSGKEAAAFTGKENEAAGGIGISGLCDRRDGADWRCAG